MKRLKTIVIISLCMFILLGTQSCLVLYKKDNGKHKGWYKSTNNPHNNSSNKQKKNHK